MRAQVRPTQGRPWITTLLFLIVAYAGTIAYLRFHDRSRRVRWACALVGGAAWGIAVSVKWVAVYAAPALVLGVAWLVAATAPTSRRGRFGTAMLKHMPCLLTCYVALPLAAYVASYVPLLWTGTLQGGLGGIVDNARAMLGYHSQLVGDHPYSSNFFEWPWNQRPLLMGQAVEAGSGGRMVLVEIGNPFLWCAGVVALFMTMGRRGLADAGRLCVTVAAAAQILPWMLVTRSTFAYHYLPTATLAIVALAGVVSTATRWRVASTAAVLTVALAFFVAFLPLSTGWAVPGGWITALSWFDTWSF